ncbi:MAG: hypothetical protein Q8Q52_03360, partial [Acidimicrobiia bacterium]|nr:hypothetical protein [Acidimicrobiia bacterium]
SAMRLIYLIFRSTPLVGLLPAGAVAIAMAVIASRQPLDTEQRLLPARLALLSVVVGVSFAFDDPAARLTDSTPRPLRLRRGIRVSLALTGAGVLTGLALLVASAGMDLKWTIPSPEPPLVEDFELTDQMPEDLLAPFPGGRLALEALTMGALALASAAVIARRGEEEPGRIAAAILLGAYAVSFSIPESDRPWANPSDQRWPAVAPWWWVAAATFLLLMVSLSWDARTGKLLRSHW